MKLKLYTHDIKPGDIVLAKGYWADKTVWSVEHKPNGVHITWTCGGTTRYGYITQLEVLREV